MTCFFCGKDIGEPPADAPALNPGEHWLCPTCDAQPTCTVCERPVARHHVGAFRWFCHRCLAFRLDTEVVKHPV